MNKEVKKEEKKNGAIYAVIAIVVVIIVGVATFFKPEANKNSAIATQPDIAEAIEVKTEPIVATVGEDTNEQITARIDITTPLVDADTPQFEVYIDDADMPEEQADWMPKFGNQGYVLQKDDGVQDIKLNALKDIDIELILRGPDKRDENNQFIPVWVTYTSLTVNGKEILQEAVNVWHNKPFRYTINAKAGEEYKIHAEWTKADK